jgi:hypothetical protein
MTQFSKDDQNLVDFLRQHQPKAPPASPDLEQQILQNVSQLRVLPQPTKYRFPKLVFFPSVIAAGLLTIIVGYPAFTPQKPTEAELTKLESFIESNWQSTVSDNSEHDVWYTPELNSD